MHLSQKARRGQHTSDGQRCPLFPLPLTSIQCLPTLSTWEGPVRPWSPSLRDQEGMAHALRNDPRDALRQDMTDSASSASPGTDKNGSRPSRSDRRILTVSGGILILLVALYWIWPSYQDFLNEAWGALSSGEEERIHEWVSQFGPWGPLVLVVLMTLQMFLFIAPSWLLMVIAVLAYGGFWGCLLSIAAVAIASAVGYGLGHLVGEYTLDRLLGEGTKRKVLRETDRYGIWAIVIARINPLLSNDAISLVGGMLHMGFWRFLGATLLGITPLAILIGVMGEDWDQMKTGLLWLSLASLAGLGLKIWFDKRKDSRKSDDSR